ncbi:TonB-dependent receptor [Methyloferula stellata]|uniref:TonB-dependent receptor n=1 Tax=Methyloferula stellata TaxID=876270 RepID=UPI0009FFC00F|nr:TonB-dependent receptor [Methyloferula stellata]
MRLVPRNTRNINPLGMGLPLWLSLTVSTGALAQAASQPAAEGTVEDVVVSAPPQTITQQQLDKVQSTPVTATVVTQQQLEAAQITSLTGAQKLEPSLNIKFSNVRNIAINVRGFGAASSTATDGVFNGTPVYLNGVYQPFVGQAIFDIPDLVGVEVLKGPQATAGGQDNTGGVVNITTALPSFTQGENFEFQYGSYNMFQEKASVTGPVAGTDWVAYRLSFFDKDQEGYLDSTTDGNKYNGTHTKSGMAQFLLTPTADLTALLSANYSTVTQAQSVAAYIGTMTNYANGTPVSNNFLARAAKLGFTPALPGSLLSTYTTNGSGWQNTADDTYQVAAKIDYTFNKWTLESVTSGGAYDFHPHNGFTLIPGIISPYGSGSQIDAKDFTQEIKLSNPTGGPVDVTGGVFFLKSLVIDHSTSTPFGPLSGAFYGTSKYSAATNNAAYNYLTQQGFDNPDTTEIAPYIRDVWHATSNLDITTGLRYSYNYKTSSFYQWIPNEIVNPQSATITALQQSQKLTPRAWYASTHQGMVSYVGTATYKFTPDVFAYATISQGGRAGGPAPAYGNLPSTAPETVKAERLENYEIGLKSQWFDQKLTANLAAFVMYDHNYIAYGATTTGNATSYLTNAPLAESRGVEIDLRAQPVEGLNLYASGTYDDAFYASFAQGACPPEITGQSTCNLTGKPLANTPKLTLVGGGEYNYRLGNVLASWGTYADKPLVAYAGADYTWQSQFFSDASGATTDSIYASIHPYGILDVHAGIKFADNSWDLVGWIHNALNKHYYTAIESTTAGEILATVGDPLMGGVTLRARF